MNNNNSPEQLKEEIQQLNERLQKLNYEARQLNGIAGLGNIKIPILSYKIHNLNDEVQEFKVEAEKTMLMSRCSMMTFKS